jgi:thiol-disulfide isomerase/thioredoxin
MKRALLGLLLAALIVPLAACNKGDLPGRANIDVDTPALRHQKLEAGLAACTPGKADRADGDKALPDVTLPCLGGGQDVDLSSLRGPMVINVWAAWCPPCRRELPIYQRFFRDHGDQVAVLGIDWNDPHPAAAIELAGEAGVDYPLLADPQDDLSDATPLPNLSGLPFIAFVDADGNVAYQMFDEINSEDELAGLVEKHLGVTL